MKKHLFILGLLIIMIPFARTYAQDSIVEPTFLIKNAIDRPFYLDKQIDLYTILPSDLWNWEYEDYSLISFKGKLDEGPFKKVDQFNRNEQFTFITSSIQTFKESGWRFYGEFKLDLGNHKTTNFNMFFEPSEIGSPFRLTIRRTGDFKTKNYRLTGLINKKFGERLSLGVTFKYFGDLFFRTRDIRIEQHNLSTELILAGNYKISESKNLSFGASFIRKKSQPLDIRSYFSQVTGSFEVEELFKLRVATGLSDLLAYNKDGKYYFEDNGPKFYLNYFTGAKNKITLAYSIKPGKEEWINRTSNVIGDQAESEDDLYKLYKYTYIDQSIIKSYLIKSKKFELLNKLEARYISGKAYKNVILDGASLSVYQKTLNYNSLTGQLSSDLMRHNKKLFRHSCINLAYKYVKKKDMEYGPLMSYTNIMAEAGTNLAHDLSEKVNFLVGINAFYKHNLDYTYTISSSVQKIYTQELAYNEIAYHSTSYMKFGVDLRVLINFKKINAEIKLDYSHLKPTDIKFTNAHSLVEKTDFRNFWNASINLYF